MIKKERKKDMIKLSESDKSIIEKLNHPFYTVEYLEEWLNRNDNVFINAPAALQIMGARGFYEAVRYMQKGSEEHET